jgi:oxygen-independent coproporphyrinogen-3 oxidase
MQQEAANSKNSNTQSRVDEFIRVGNRNESPDRGEFYTNYPFYKYWKNGPNSSLTGPEVLNIYIHIPFCIQICDYCFYMKELVKSKDQVDEYVEALCREIELVSTRLCLRHRTIESIYIGGGTPSVLTEKQFKKIVDTLAKFHVVEGAEFTFEAEPGTFTSLKLGWYKETGVNRVSMGVQSFVNEIIQMSSRKHTVQQAINSIKMVQDAGGFIINIDLLSGLAGETMDTWKATMDIAVQQPIDTITVYKMKAYANTVFFKKGVHKQEIHLPSDLEEFAFFNYAFDKLSEEGFTRWTNFAFSRSGYRHKYIENTWRGGDLVSYGASSFGKLGNTNYQNLNNIEQYIQKINKNELPVFRSYTLTHKDQIVKELLLCASRLSSYSKQEFIDKFGFDYFNLIPETLDELNTAGLITGDSQDLILTRKGIVYGDFVGKILAMAVKSKIGDDAFEFIY